MLHQELLAGDQAELHKPRKAGPKAARVERMKRRLHTALTLGNLFGKAVQLYYQDHYERFVAREAVVIAVTDRFVILEGGRSIPQSRIRKVVL